jgi:hypothetical protein
VFVSRGNDTNAHTDSNRQRMQPVSIRVPGWKSVLLLLRDLGVHAALSSLLRASLFKPAAAPDSNADAEHHTHLSSTPSVRVPAGLREGVRVHWRMHDLQLRATGNADCDTGTNSS